jgi:hypothetical protein
VKYWYQRYMYKLMDRSTVKHRNPPPRLKRENEAFLKTKGAVPYFHVKPAQNSILHNRTYFAKSLMHQIINLKYLSVYSRAVLYSKISLKLQSSSNEIKSR